MSKREEIAKNLRQFELEKAQRMQNFWYRLRVKMYQKFKIVL